VCNGVSRVDDAPRAYQIFEQKLDGAIKVLLRP